MMSLYDVFMIPLERNGIKKARQELIPNAKGEVLEIGSGTGVNLKHYNFDEVTTLTVTDRKLSNKIKKIVPETVELNEIDVTALPYEDNAFDYVVHTLVFCSVDNVSKGLSEIKRVLKPDRRLLFIEHIHPEGGRMKKLFSFVNPAWKKIASGCNLTRDYESSLLLNGFDITYSGKFMNTVFVYGEARKKDVS